MLQIIRNTLGKLTSELERIIFGAWHFIFENSTLVLNQIVLQIL